MGVETAIIAAGIGMQVFGNISANNAEAAAQRENAAFYREQQRLALKAAEREQRLFDLESDQFIGAQTNAFARGGVDMSGSTLMQMASTAMEIKVESSAIIQQAKDTGRLSLLRAEQAESQARRLGSFGHNFMQTSGTVLGGAGAIMGANKPTPKSGDIK